ncbi:hypothetical protein ABIE44_002676 [Marmoricola sp. OAE513]|uniref:hypothetical protein n=1 Tax=Marmoricola sp. OAE513 TaxID=2817894 RepID=UPI001AE2FA18
MKERGFVAAAAASLVLLAGCGGYTGQRPPEDEPGVANGQGANGNGDGPAVPNLSIPPVTSPASASTASKAPASGPASGSAKPSKAATKASTGCGKVGKVNLIGFVATSKIRKSVQSFRVTLSQGTLSRTAWTADDLKNRHGFPVVPGVGVEGDNFTFVLGGSGNRPTALPGSWNAETKATLLIEGLAGDGRSIYQQSRTFKFKTTYPNGKACDKTPALSFGTKLTEANRISKS